MPILACHLAGLHHLEQMQASKILRLEAHLLVNTASELEAEPT